MKRTVKAGVLAAALGALCALLCGCGGSAEEFTILDGGEAYQAHLLSEGASWDAITSAQVMGEDCSFLTVEDGEKTIVSHYRAEDIAITGGDYFLMACSAGEDIYALESGTEDGLRLVRMTYDGQATGAADITGSDAETLGEGIAAMAADAAGNVYIAWNQGQTGHLEVFSPELEVLCSLKASGGISAVAALGEDVYCLVAGTKLVPVELESGSLGTALELGRIFTGLCADGESLYLSDGNGLWRAELEKKTLEAVLTVSEAGMTGSVLAAGAYGEDGYLIVTQQGVYKAAPADAEDTRTVIRVAVAYGADLLLDTAAINFNSSSEDYRVEITTYDDETATAFLTQLAAGDVPDMFYFTASYPGPELMDSRTLGEQGYLLDMYTLLDADGDFSRDMFVSNILGAAEAADGSLYAFPVTFGMSVVAASASVVGDRTSWTPSECLAFLRSSGYTGYLFGPECTQINCLAMLLRLNFEAFIDRENGTCSFDSEEFKSLLELVKEYAPAELPEDGDVKNIILYAQEGSLLMTEQAMDNINAIQIFDGVFDDPVYIGLPCPAGSGNGLFFGISFGISAVSENTEAVWAFAKTLFEEQYDEFAYGYSILQARLDEYLDNGQDGVWGVGSGSGDYAYLIWVTEVTEEDRAAVRGLIQSLDNVYSPNNELLTIIGEIAQDYLDGRKTLDETAASIQSRASIYIAEQG